jgi:hypothetical protein
VVYIGIYSLKNSSKCSNSGFSSSDCGVGTTYGFKYNPKKGTIEIFRKGKSLGVAYTNIKKGLELHPAFDFHANGGNAELIKPDFK